MTGQAQKRGGKKTKTASQNKRALCAEDETPWETKEETSKVVGGFCGGGSAASQDPERVDVLEVVFAFSI